MMKKLHIQLIVAGLLCTQFIPAQTWESDKFTLLWVVEGLEVPESVLPVPEKGILYVSNIGAQDPTSQENSGFISVLKDNGQIVELKWSEGLDSPKGMAIAGDKLYVTEVDQIAEIDLKTGEKLNAYPVEGAKFLNDIAADKRGALYITDSRTGTVHKLSKGEVKVFVRSDDFPNPNGVIIHNNKLLLGTGEKIVSIDLATGKVSDYMKNTGGVDGLALISDDFVVFSDWPGKVHMMKGGEEKILLLDTTSSEKIKTADFGFDPDTRILYIPSFFGNSIMAYQLEISP